MTSTPSRSAHLYRKVNDRSCSPDSWAAYSASVRPVASAISCMVRSRSSRNARMRPATSSMFGSIAARPPFGASNAAVMPTATPRVKKFSHCIATWSGSRGVKQFGNENSAGGTHGGAKNSRRTERVAKREAFPPGGGAKAGRRALPQNAQARLSGTKSADSCTSPASIRGWRHAPKTPTRPFAFSSPSKAVGREQRLSEIGENVPFPTVQENKKPSRSTRKGPFAARLPKHAGSGPPCTWQARRTECASARRTRRAALTWQPALAPSAG